MDGMPEPRLDPELRARYARQIRLSGFGEAAQAKLLDSHVLVIGAGGLGAPVLSYLTAVGIGTISVIDPDVIELSNLHRQVIHDEAGVGTRKIDSAQQRMQALNSTIEIRTYPQLLTADNALDLIGEVDIVVDGSDNFATRYLANDACEILHKPLVWGTILGFDGQVAVFDADAGATLRDLYPNVPAPGSVPDCATAGVLGPLCGSIGSAMAMETIKVLTGIGAPLKNAVAIHSSLDASWETVPVSRRPDREPVTDLHEHLSDYGQDTIEAETIDAEGGAAGAVGDAAAAGGSRGVDLGPAEIRWPDVAPGQTVVDIREDDEVAAGMVPGAIHIAMDELLESPNRLASAIKDNGQADTAEAAGGAGAALYCRSGARSAKTAAQLRSQGFAVSSISGGYLAYLSQPSTQSS
jgi:molybdopterin/thiamine biosynthesis adenylyltransferase/rhodanese-related sulfurtransferase